MQEPGIGILIIVSFAQFFVGNIILWLLEAKPYSNFLNGKSIGNKRKINQEAEVNKVLSLVLYVFFVDYFSVQSRKFFAK